MGEIVQVNNISNTETPRLVSAPARPRPPPISAPPYQFRSPSHLPLLNSVDQIEPAGKTPRTSTPRSFTPRLLTPRFITPLATPIKKALKLTRLDPHDAWLPITESRNGNAYYAAFHTLCAGIGIQALVLPVAFPVLGWAGGVIALTMAFIWQLYTLYILVQLHENVETGVRYSRYMQLCNATFGEKLSNWIVQPTVLQLSGGTCLALIIIGGSSMKTFYQTVCGKTCMSEPLTTVEWYLVFTCAAVVLSQLPNLNSIAGVSLIGAISAVGYCTIIWVVSVAKGRLPGVSYNPVQSSSKVIVRTVDVLNALGIIAFTFRGHNLTLEIQATMPSSEKHPSTVPMWKGVKFAYLLVPMCLFPIAIGGYWAYGQKIPTGGMLTALYTFHSRDTSQFILGLTSVFVIINAVSSFQIYGMPIFDDMESQYVKRKKQSCPWWLRVLFRGFFGFVVFFFAVAVPFASCLTGLLGGIALPITLAYPCFMWLKVKKPKKYSPVWCLDWGLGVLGLVLSGLLVAASTYVIIKTGIKATMPSSEKHPSTVPMWKGVKFAYLFVAMCLYPPYCNWRLLGIWSKGGGMLAALYVFHGKDMSQFILGLKSMFVIINSISSFQIYGMPIFDNSESKYVKKKKKPCPWWLRALFRGFFGFSQFFFAVAMPFAANMARLVGGIALPITLVYPCFMWLKIKKPKAYSPIWCLNWGLGIVGIVLSGLFVFFRGLCCY